MIHAAWLVPLILASARTTAPQVVLVVDLVEIDRAQAVQNALDQGPEVVPMLADTPLFSIPRNDPALLMYGPESACLTIGNLSSVLSRRWIGCPVGEIPGTTMRHRGHVVLVGRAGETIPARIPTRNLSFQHPTVPRAAVYADVPIGVDAQCRVDVVRGDVVVLRDLMVWYDDLATRPDDGHFRGMPDFTGAQTLINAELLPGQMAIATMASLDPNGYPTFVLVRARIVDEDVNFDESDPLAEQQLFAFDPCASWIEW